MKRFTALVAVLFAVLFAVPATSSADFGISSFNGATLNKAGEYDRQAGGHPFEQQINFTFPTKADSLGNLAPDGNVKDVEIDFPAGFVGDPSAAAVCHEAEIEIGNPVTHTSLCPDGSQVGLVELELARGGSVVQKLAMPLLNMGAQNEVSSEFAYVPLIAFLHSRAYVRTGSDYGITIKMRDLPQPVAVVGAHIHLWGVPSDPGHDQWRNRLCLVGFFCFSGPSSTSWPRLPFISNPTDCSAESLVTKIRADSWQEPGQYKSAEFSFPGPENCNVLNFHPSFQWQPDNPRAGAPSGYSFDLHVTPSRNPDGYAVPPVKKVVATLPEGTVISPAGADGLESCSSSVAKIDNDLKQECPTGSAVGDAYLETQLLPRPVKGTIYLATPHDNPFDSLYAVYVMFEGFGTRIKLPGKVEIADDGQIRTTFDNNPQLPFTNLHLHFGGGSRAILSNPTTCGTKTMTMEMTSWAGQSARATSDFEINQNCAGGGFSPTLDAGAQNPVAGKPSPFLLRLLKPEQDPPLKTINLTLPAGELAKLKGVPYCSDATLASIPTQEGTGEAELAHPSCPAASQVGTATVTSGPGPTPLYVSGKVYLAGPYKGAPLSIAVVTPAISGPYDLGTVVVRNALRVDPVTAQVESVSDPLPTSLYGVPLGLREVWVNLDREGFAQNPTSCEPTTVDGLIESTEAPAASVSTRFQVGDCASLGFKPKLAFTFSGATHRSAHPRFKAVLKTRPGDANLGKAVVTLPKTEYLEQSHIRTVCTRVQYAEDKCPKGSIYGYAKAWSPLLDEPLKGPVYLRSSNHTLPDLVASLRGQIQIDLDGRIDSVNGRIRNTFAAIPDAAVTKFVLTMQGGKKGLLVNNTELCGANPRASVQFTGQNGKHSDANPLVQTDCGGKHG